MAKVTIPGKPATARPATKTNPQCGKLHLETLRTAALLWFLLGIAVCGAKAQKRGQAYIDSLQTELQKAAADTNKVNLLCELSYKYSSLNTEEGLKHGKEALALAKDLNWEKA